jgi:hypothetical protein
MILNKVYVDMADPSRFLVPTNTDGRTVQVKVFWAKPGGMVFGGRTEILQRLFPDQTENPAPFHFRMGFVAKDLLDKQRAEKARNDAQAEEFRARRDSYRNRNSEA